MSIKPAAAGNAADALIRAFADSDQSSRGFREEEKPWELFVARVAPQGAIELDTPTNARVVPMKFERRRSFSAMNAPDSEQS
jgi:hypothetical protein